MIDRNTGGADQGSVDTPWYKNVLNLLLGVVFVSVILFVVFVILVGFVILLTKIT